MAHPYVGPTYHRSKWSLAQQQRRAIAAMVSWLEWFSHHLEVPSAHVSETALCWHTGFWGTGWCLIYQTLALLKDVADFFYDQVLCADRSRESAPFLSGFLAHYPQYAQLIPETLKQAKDTFSLVALCLWISAFMLLAFQLLLSCERRFCRSPEVLFFPDPSGQHVQHLCHLLRGSRRRMWIAMFTLTDDVLSQEIINAWERNVDVKVILDQEQFNALGADGAKLMEHGVPVLLDHSMARMHHKFAVVDDCVLTGSFNWTRQASASNWENLCILRDPAAVSPFTVEFRRLWADFGATTRRKRGATPPGR